jgi:hypothetical protein
VWSTSLPTGFEPSLVRCGKCGGPRGAKKTETNCLAPRDFLLHYGLAGGPEKDLCKSYLSMLVDKGAVIIVPEAVSNWLIQERYPSSHMSATKTCKKKTQRFVFVPCAPAVADYFETLMFNEPDERKLADRMMIRLRPIVKQVTSAIAAEPLFSDIEDVTVESEESANGYRVQPAGCPPPELAIIQNHYRNYDAEDQKVLLSVLTHPKPGELLYRTVNVWTVDGSKLVRTDRTERIMQFVPLAPGRSLHALSEVAIPVRDDDLPDFDKKYGKPGELLDICMELGPEIHGVSLFITRSFGDECLRLCKHAVFSPGYYHVLAQCLGLIEEEDDLEDTIKAAGAIPTQCPDEQSTWAGLPTKRPMSSSDQPVEVEEEEDEVIVEPPRSASKKRVRFDEDETPVGGKQPSISPKRCAIDEEPLDFNTLAALDELKDLVFDDCLNAFVHAFSELADDEDILDLDAEALSPVLMEVHDFDGTMPEALH